MSLTYGEVGATKRVDLVDRPPAGYRSLQRRARIGSGVATFREAGDALLNWQLQRRSGFRVIPDDRVSVGARVRLLIPFGPFSVPAPAEVVYMIDEPRRIGFAYGTLPGHPESGEEAFVVELDDDDSVWVSVRAFWRPANRLWSLVYPVLRLTQEFYTRRYLRSLA